MLRTRTARRPCAVPLSPLWRSHPCADTAQRLRLLARVDARRHFCRSRRYHVFPGQGLPFRDHVPPGTACPGPRASPRVHVQTSNPFRTEV